MLSWRTRNTIVRPSGDSTTAGPASTASDPGTPMLLTTRVTGNGGLTMTAAGSVDNQRPSVAASAMAVAAKRIHGRERRGDGVIGAAARSAASSAAGPAIARSSVTRASPTSRSRCLGSRSRQRSRSIRTARGVAGGSTPKSIGWRSTAAIVSEMSSPLNKRCPVSISTQTTPNAQTSARRSTALPRACSGAM